MKLYGIEVQSKIDNYVQLEWIKEDNENKVLVYPKYPSEGSANKLVLGEFNDEEGTGKEYLFIVDDYGTFSDRIKEIDYDHELIKFYSFPRTINPTIDVFAIGVK